MLLLTGDARAACGARRRPAARSSAIFAASGRLSSPSIPAGTIRVRPPAGAYPADELRADLTALRPAFDGLVLYGFDATLTPGIVEQAATLGYRAVLLGIWDPKSEAEVAGVADLVRRYRDRLALAVCIGNEGINDNRYTIEDLERRA